jgi:hypothetical protein
MSFDRTAFDARIAQVGLKHISSGELLARISAKNKFGTKNSPPPQRLWDNIIPTALVLDELRAHYGKSITLISGYRSEAYNQAAKSKDDADGYHGRAKTSQHMAFSAFDFRISGVACTETAALLQQWEDEGKMFYSPVDFARKAEKVDAGNIPFGELPRTWRLGWFGVWFSFAGYIKAYPSDNFTHLDTRGKTKKESE